MKAARENYEQAESTWKRRARAHILNVRRILAAFPHPARAFAIVETLGIVVKPVVAAAVAAGLLQADLAALYLLNTVTVCNVAIFEMRNVRAP